MKNAYRILKIIIGIIALLIFLAGVVLVLLGTYDFAMAFSRFGSSDKHKLAGAIAIGLLAAVDLYLIAIVFFVFSLGLLVLFESPGVEIPVKIPEWLRVKNFIQLKVILWESILTTLVIGYLTSVAEKRISYKEINVHDLIIPAGILLIALSLYFLKKGENHENK